MVQRFLEGAAAMTQLDQQLLDKQFNWVNKSSNGLLALSFVSAVLLGALLWTTLAA
jgi:hypothetical protein